MQIIIKRLELIKNCILLEDDELINLQIKKFDSIEHDKSVAEIIKMLDLKQFSDALHAIEDYIGKNTGIAVYQDKEVAALKFELKALEQKLQELTRERNECLSLIEDFNVEHNVKLGDIIREILDIKSQILYQQIINKKRLFENRKKAWQERKDKINDIKGKIEDLEEELDATDPFSDEYEDISERLQTAKEECIEDEEELEKLRKQTKEAKEELESDPANEEYEETVKDKKTFEEEYQEAVQAEEELSHLNNEQKKELKKLYRKAIKLCHPDIVEDDFKEKAHEITVDLNKARKAHDIERLKEILAMLESGEGFSVASDVIFDKEVLKNKINNINELIRQSESELSEIKSSEIFEIISEYDDLDVYFDELKEHLEASLQELKQNLKEEEDLYNQFSEVDFEEHMKIHNNPVYQDVMEKHDDEYQSEADDEDTYWDEMF